MPSPHYGLFGSKWVIENETKLYPDSIFSYLSLHFDQIIKDFNDKYRVSGSFMNSCSRPLHDLVDIDHIRMTKVVSDELMAGRGSTSLTWCKSDSAPLPKIAKRCYAFFLYQEQVCWNWHPIVVIPNLLCSPTDSFPWFVSTHCIHKYLDLFHADQRIDALTFAQVRILYNRTLLSTHFWDLWNSRRLVGVCPNPRQAEIHGSINFGNSTRKTLLKQW